MTLIKRKKIHGRIRKRIKGTAKRPRLSVFRSLKYIYAALINDDLGKTIVSANEKEIKGAKKMSNIERSEAIGKLIAEKAIKNKIKEVVFDRSGYKYHGRIRALADGARKAGLKF